MIDDFPMLVLLMILVGLCSLIWRKLREVRDATSAHEPRDDGPAHGGRQRNQEKTTATTMTDNGDDDEDVTIAEL